MPVRGILARRRPGCKAQPQPFPGARFAAIHLRRNTVIRATELSGRAVVDIDAAERLGRVDRIVLDPDARQVAGFVVSRGSSLLGGGEHSTLPASSVHAIGPDAITVRRQAAEPTDQLSHLPRVSDMVGRKVVSETGRVLGKVHDVLIDERDGRIIGYALAGDGLDDKLKAMLPSMQEHDERRMPYLRADANLKAGKDLIVAPEDAMAYDTASTDSNAESVGGPGAPVAGGWSTSANPPAQPSPWVRVSDAGVERLDREGREE
jgi:sporulation protein YlmC with PRC-barrel domain